MIIFKCMKKITSLLLTSLIFLGLNVSPIKNDIIKINDELKVEKANEDIATPSQLYCAHLVKSNYIKINTENDEYKDYLELSNLKLFTGNENLSLDDIANLSAEDLFSFQDYQGDYQVLYENNVIYDSTLSNNTPVYIDDSFQTGTNTLTVKAINNESQIADGTISIVVSEPLSTYTSLLKISKLPNKINYEVSDIVSFEGIEVQKLTYTATPIVDSNPQDLYQYHVDVEITSAETLYFEDLDISLFESEDYKTGIFNETTNRIESLGFYPFIIGEVGHTNGDYLDWDPQFTTINFFVIMFLNNIIPYINLEIISLPDKLTYYNDDVYAPTGLYIGYTLTLNNEKMPFNIKLLYYTPYYIDNSGNKVNLSPGQTKFTNINEGPVTIYVDQVLGDISYQVSYNIEFINKPNPEVADSIIPNDQYIMYFSITLGLIFIVIGAVGLAVHLYLRKRKNK